MILLDDTLGFDFINEHIIELAQYLSEFVDGNMNSMVGAAKALGVIFALIVVAIECYKVMAKQQAFDILSIARPILFAFVLANWGAVCSTVMGPGAAVEIFMKDKFEVEKQQIVDLRQKRNELSTNLAKKLREKRAAADALKEQTENNKGIVGQALDVLEDAWETMKEWSTQALAVMQTYIKNWIEEGFVWLGELYWQVSVYFIFLLQSIFKTVLIMFGPITFTCSILPVWKDAWTQCVGKMVAVSLYGAMAYLVMIFSMQLIKYGIIADTQILTGMVEGDETLVTYCNAGFGSTIQTVIGLICGGMAMKTVPEISSWVVPSSMIHGAGQFLAGTAGTIQSKATSMATGGAIK